MKTCCLCALLIASLAGADSLYTAQSPFASPFGDRKASRVGDVVQILISESAQANQSANDQTANKNNTAIAPGAGLLAFLPTLGYSGSITAQSSGSTTRSASFTTRLAAMVVGVTPSGNLLLEAPARCGCTRTSRSSSYRGRYGQRTSSQTTPCRRIR
jgi:flagellar L-ring protein FlgH